MPNVLLKNILLTINGRCYYAWFCLSCCPIRLAYHCRMLLLWRLLNCTEKVGLICPFVI
jgi:hypothetical protein